MTNNYYEDQFYTVLQSAVSGQQCGTIGHVPTSSGVHDDRNAFYLNRGDPADCSGTMTSVNYCFSGATQTASLDEYQASFATYRFNGATNTYSNVSSVITLRVTEDQVRSVASDNFTSSSIICSKFTLDQPLPIEAGEVLGVCIFDPPGNTIHSLNLVGSVGTDTSDLLRLRPAPDCTETSVPRSIDDSHSDHISNKAIYLYANIGR